MSDRTSWYLTAVFAIAAVAIYIAMPWEAGVFGRQVQGVPFFNRVFDITYHRGLDLQGGLRVLLEADLPEGATPPTGEQMDTAKQIIERRVNGLGVSEPVVQRVGGTRILVELPGVDDPDQAVASFGGTGLLEFVDGGEAGIPEGTRINTTLQPEDQRDPSLQTYTTVLTGADLDPNSVQVALDPTTTQPIILFGFKGGEPTNIITTYTGSNIGRYMAIAVDKVIISSPQIEAQIPGSGQITGRFTREEADALVLQLKYGSLPVPLKVIENRTVGATLGNDSVRRSAIAGLIGLVAVAIFMIAYYRLPGVLAVLALMIYTAITLALFKIIPVTLTLAGIAGFLLSVGMAVDANILIFERMKEELRAGRNLRYAVKAGFDRAWPSIRDSNASTLITCGILFLFGANFGASIVQGFALTLAVGVLVSLFTAITVTRTLLAAVMESITVKELRWFGI